MNYDFLTIFSNGIINREKPSQETLIGVRPKYPVLVPFDWHIAAFGNIHIQAVMLNVTDRWADLKNKTGTNSVESSLKLMLTGFAVPPFSRPFFFFDFFIVFCK